MRVLVEPVGWLLVLLGLVLLPLPGPGVVVLVGGLVVLAERYEWAARQLHRARAVAGDRAVSTPARAAVSITSTAVLALAGLLWIWPGWSWLPGGVWAGVGQLVSGVAALALLLVEHRRHRRARQATAAVASVGLRRSGMLDPMEPGGVGVEQDR
ncbi:PGPGW domain-containing protein [Nocardioides sp. SOB77]|uniref:PGPGW domain-containing protein n=1 Tax=Nocardioides oceani TaxID=3058369 RepID=A0ABT8FBG8_9ACTN|nr:PGPGW domain-containing protein [Nocardioides oceani]MDN4172036.1 PGPGW domain-containing protein [Nocardioides oceani]